MTRPELLAALHLLMRPRNSSELGVNGGRRLALADVPATGVDPACKIDVPRDRDAILVKATRDACFVQPDPLRHLRPSERLRGPRRCMHRFEFALRDFMGASRADRASNLNAGLATMGRDAAFHASTAGAGRDPQSEG
jgi:hypothetical protein